MGRYKLGDPQPRPPWSPPVKAFTKTRTGTAFKKCSSDTKASTSARKKAKEVEMDDSTQRPSDPPSSAQEKPRETADSAVTDNHCRKPVFQRACVTHNSHSHPLRPMEAKAEDELICYGCGLDLTGSAYKCSKSNCHFLLHRSCFSLDPVLQHDSHKQHSLTLLSSPPEKYPDGIFVCCACDDDGTGFVYHCSDCQFDLHVSCALLPKNVEHEDHKQHRLFLIYHSTPKDMEFVCNVCKKVVPEEQWMYYCARCHYGTHLGCATTISDSEEEEEEEEETTISN